MDSNAGALEPDTNHLGWLYIHDQQILFLKEIVFVICLKMNLNLTFEVTNFKVISFLSFCSDEYG